MEEATGDLVKFNLAGWVKKGGTGKLFLREGIASNEDTSELSSEALESILVKPRFVKQAGN